jgi:hypothetical protein
VSEIVLASSSSVYIFFVKWTRPKHRWTKAGEDDRPKKSGVAQMMNDVVLNDKLYIVIVLY